MPGRRESRRRSRLVILFLPVFALAVFPGCRRPPPDEEIRQALQSTVAQLSAKLDGREAVFDIAFSVERGTVTLTGKTSELAAKEEILSRTSVMRGVRVLDRAEVLPPASLGDRIFGVVKEPVVNLGDGPGSNTGSHVVTQAKVGDVLKLLEEKDGWFLVRMNLDGYLGWIRDDQIWRVDQTTLDSYLSGKVALVTAVVTPARSAPGGKKIFDRDLVQGVVLPVRREEKDWVSVLLPGGDVAWVPARDVALFGGVGELFAETKRAEDVIATARQFLGLAYLWGGTTAYGFDCSGFTQFCFRMNGYFLRRDADMQYEMGEPVTDRSELKPGDLVFFETYRKGPSHVGIYIGDSRFIHSGSAGVTINSFDPSHSDYSPDLAKKYLGARRIIR